MIRTGRDALNKTPEKCAIARIARRFCDNRVPGTPVQSDAPLTTASKGTNRKSSAHKLYEVFTPRERAQAAVLFIGSLVSALMQTLGVAVIFPFINVAMTPEAIRTNKWLSSLYRRGGFTDAASFMVFLGGLVLAVIIVSNIVPAVVAWGKARFLLNKDHALSTRLLTMLLTVHVKATLAAMALLGGAYGLFAFFIRTALRRKGALRVEANTNRYRCATEALSSMKTTRVMGVEEYFIDNYSANSLNYAAHTRFALVAGELPRYFIEAVAFGGIIYYLVSRMAAGANISDLLPLVSLYAFAAYRMMPALHRNQRPGHPHPQGRYHRLRRHHRLRQDHAG